MAKPERMSQEDQTRLLGAIDFAQELVDQGSDPTAALCKAAKQEDLPAGHVRLLVHSWNNGSANFHRKTASDLYEKTASIPLVNVEDVLERLYPSKFLEPTKPGKSHTKEAREAAKRVDPSWLTPPRKTLCFDKQNFQEREAQTLRFYGNLPTQTPKQDLTKEALALLDQVQRESDEQLLKISALTQRVEESFHTLRKEALAASESYPILRRELIAGFGDKAKELLVRLEKTSSLLEKLASSALTKHSFALDPSKGCFKAAKEHLHFLEELQVAKEKHQKYAQDTRIDHLREYLHRPTARTSTPRDPRSPKTSLLKEAEEEGAFNALGRNFTGAFNPTVRSFASPVFGQAYLPRNFRQDDEKAFAALQDPAHELQLRKVRTTAMIHDLMANDPVVSEHDPEEVIAAFNELQRLAPKTFEQPAAVRAMLRKYLSQGGVDTHEIKGLTEMEEKIKKTTEPPRSLMSNSLLADYGAGRNYDKENTPAHSKNLTQWLADTTPGTAKSPKTNPPKPESPKGGKS